MRSLLRGIVGVGSAIFLTMGGVASAHSVPEIAPPGGTTAGGTIVTGVAAPGFAAVEASLASALALTSEGEIFTWGGNPSGELGNGSSEWFSEIPGTIRTDNIPGGVAFIAIAAGDNHMTALGDDGIAYVWGNNSSGQLGIGTIDNVIDTPVPFSTSTTEIPPGVQIVDLAAGSEHTLALGSDGWVYSWGSNISGQLGNGAVSNTPSTTPVSVNLPLGISFTSISAGWNSSFAVSSEGAIYAWGDNTYGQLGDGTIPLGGGIVSPIPVLTLSLGQGITATAVFAGYQYTLALGSDGNVYVWGSNSAGQLGTGAGNLPGDPMGSGTPTPLTNGAIPNGTTFVDIGTGLNAAAGLSGDGIVYTWGEGGDGLLGNNTTGPGTPCSCSTPVQTSAIGEAVTQLAGGHATLYALGSSGAVYGWGRGDLGQLGNGEAFTSSLVPVLGVHTVVESVFFGSTQGFSFTNENGIITVTSPVNPEGIVDITVGAGVFAGSVDTQTTITATAVEAFTYVAPPSIITNALPSAVTGADYSSQIAVAGGVVNAQNYNTFTDLGTLPVGLSIDSSGVISGVPREVGTREITVRVSNLAGEDTQSFFLTTTAGQPEITVEVIPHSGPADPSERGGKSLAHTGENPAALWLWACVCFLAGGGILFCQRQKKVKLSGTEKV
ncbi:hypothetical protein [Lysinibacter sp. HNR]|uniref:RCC1 domain-containing protein n=1 Tax=Lysinibacter sp. HNR TaxID=3031408 RepID=UPI00243586A8|nr:hypothetical protein [Lysinibacter sp. HNR]WGD36877.1 hypothetical protein FrondiHNR_10540 [Lysinibacter sp. HNR]